MKSLLSCSVLLLIAAIALSKVEASSEIKKQVTQELADTQFKPETCNLENPPSSSEESHNSLKSGPSNEESAITLVSQVEPCPDKDQIGCVGTGCGLKPTSPRTIERSKGIDPYEDLIVSFRTVQLQDETSTKSLRSVLMEHRSRNKTTPEEEHRIKVLRKLCGVKRKHAEVILATTGGRNWAAAEAAIKKELIWNDEEVATSKFVIATKDIYECALFKARLIDPNLTGFTFLPSELDNVIMLNKFFLTKRFVRHLFVYLSMPSTSSRYHTLPNTSSRYHTLMDYYCSRPNPFKASLITSFLRRNIETLGDLKSLDIFSITDLKSFAKWSVSFDNNIDLLHGRVDPKEFVKLDAFLNDGNSHLSTYLLNLGVLDKVTFPTIKGCESVVEGARSIIDSFLIKLYSEHKLQYSVPTRYLSTYNMLPGISNIRSSLKNDSKIDRSLIFKYVMTLIEDCNTFASTGTTPLLKMDGDAASAYDILQQMDSKLAERLHQVDCRYDIYQWILNDFWFDPNMGMLRVIKGEISIRDYLEIWIFDGSTHQLTGLAILTELFGETPKLGVKLMETAEWEGAQKRHFVVWKYLREFYPKREPSLKEDDEHCVDVGIVFLEQLITSMIVFASIGEKYDNCSTGGCENAIQTTTAADKLAQDLPIEPVSFRDYYRLVWQNYKHVMRVPTRSIANTPDLWEAFKKFSLCVVIDLDILDAGYIRNLNYFLKVVPSRGPMNGQNNLPELEGF